MNEATIKFHIENIEKNNRQKAHLKEIRQYVSELRLTAYNLKGTPVGQIADKKADEVDVMINNAILKSIQV